MTDMFSIGDSRSNGQMIDAAMRQTSVYENRAVAAEDRIQAMASNTEQAILMILESLQAVTDRLNLVTAQLYPGIESNTASAGGVGHPEQHSPFMYRTGDLLLSHQWRSPPPGWLPCAGGTYLIKNYPALYSVLGDRYDRGDGYPEHGSDTIFRLPLLLRNQTTPALGIDIDPTEPTTIDNPGFNPGDMPLPGSGDFEKDLGYMMRI